MPHYTSNISAYTTFRPAGTNYGAHPENSVIEDSPYAEGEASILTGDTIAHTQFVRKIKAGNNITVAEEGKDIVINSTGGVSGAVLNDLDDVSVPAPNNGEVLTYNSGTGNWENQVLPAGISTLVGLTDTNITGEIDKQVLSWNAGANEWQNTTQNLNDHGDTNFNQTLNGHMLVYDTGSGTYTQSDRVIADTVGLITTVTGTNRVDIDSTNISLRPSAPPTSYAEISTANKTELQYATDIASVDKAIPNVKFVKDSITAINLDKALNDITDVTLTAPTAEDILVYDAATSQWVNRKKVNVQYRTGPGAATSFNMTFVGTAVRIVGSNDNVDGNTGGLITYTPDAEVGFFTYTGTVNRLFKIRLNVSGHSPDEHDILTHHTIQIGRGGFFFPQADLEFPTYSKNSITYAEESGSGEYIFELQPNDTIRPVVIKKEASVGVYTFTYQRLDLSIQEL